MTCEYCGRQLLKGEKCSCSGAVKARDKGKNSGNSYGGSYDGYGSFTSFDNIKNDMPDIDLTESGYTSSSSDPRAEDDKYCNHNGTYFHQQTSAEDDKSCNHNGTYFHQQTGWINANSSSSSSPNSSQYVYADYPRKKKTNTIAAVAIIIIITSFVIPVIALVAFVGSNNSYDNTPEWDYDYNDYHYDSNSGFTYDNDAYTSTTDYDYETGSLDDDVYTNYWANMTFNMPKRYEEGTSSEYSDYSSTTEDCAFLAFKDDGFGYIVITTSDSSLYKLYSTDELMKTLSDNIKESFEESEMDYKITETYDREIAGENWLCFDVNLIEFGYMNVAFHRIDQGIVYMIVYDNTKNQTEKFIDSIKPLE